MGTKEFQKLCTKTIGDIDKKYNLKRDNYLCFTQLMEEVGEIHQDGRGIGWIEGHCALEEPAPAFTVAGRDCVVRRELVEYGRSGFIDRRAG